MEPLLPSALSLRARLLGLLGALLVVSLGMGVAAITLAAGPRIRAEAESVTRLSTEFVASALTGVKNAPNPGAALDALLADFRNLRHVRIYVDAQGGAEPPALDSDAPDWFDRLIASRPSVVRIPLDAAVRPGATLVIASNPEDEVAEIWMEVRNFAAFGAAIALAAFALTGFLVTRSLRPVASVSAGLERLERGDYTVRLSTEGSSDFIGIAERLNALSARLSTLSLQNRALGQRIVHAQDEERQEIARNLHDEIGPSLFAIRAGLAALVRRAQAGPIDATTLEQSTRPIAAQVEALQQINRRILTRLRPAALDELGLAEALRALVEGWRESAPAIVARLDVRIAGESMDETIALTAYRIVQEALTNVMRHAGATRVDVDVARRGDRIRIRIVDDGAGFEEGAAWGFGLKGMSERLAALGGRLDLGRADDGGAAVEADMPLRSG